MEMISAWLIPPFFSSLSLSSLPLLIPSSSSSWDSESNQKKEEQENPIHQLILITKFIHTPNIKKRNEINEIKYLIIFPFPLEKQARKTNQFPFSKFTPHLSPLFFSNFSFFFPNRGNEILTFPSPPSLPLFHSLSIILPNNNQHSVLLRPLRTDRYPS